MIIVCNAYAEVIIIIMLILKTILRWTCPEERHHGHDLHVYDNK